MLFFQTRQFQVTAALRSFCNASALTLCLSLALFTAPVAAQNLTLGTKLELNTLDPHFFNAFPTGSSHEMLYETLVRLDAAAQVKPALATSWRSLDTKTWEFKLRAGVKFHDGSSLSADDVLATIDRVPKVPNTPNSFAQFTRSIERATKVDDLTVRFVTKDPNPTLPHDLASVFIIPARIAKSATTADFNAGKAAVGTGAFKLVEWVNGDRLVLARNEAYWGVKSPWVQVTEKVIAKDASRLAALMSGQVDAIDEIPLADLARLRSDARYSVYRGPMALVHYIALDSARDVSPFVTAKDGSALTRNPLKDVRVRKALSLAIPRTLIVDRLLEGAGVPAAGPTLPTLQGSSTALKPDTQDMPRAQALLKEAGWADGFKITLHATSERYPADAAIAQAVAQAWTRLGLAVAVDTMPGTVFFTRASKQEFSAFAAQYGIEEVGGGLRALLGTTDPAKGFGTANRVRYSNVDIDAKLADALATLDLSERARKLEKVSEAYMADQALIPLLHPIGDFAARKGLVVEPRPQRRFNGLMIRPQ